MTAQGPKWNRREEDDKLRGEVLTTLGSVQTAIGLFEKSLSDAKARFELRAQELADKVDEHEDQLNGTAKQEGFFQWMHQADRNIKALIKGVLGEDGSNYEKSIKGQLSKVVAELAALQAQFEAQQVTSKVQMDSLIGLRTHHTTIRGQNIFVWVAVIGLIGTITAASVREWQPALWAKILHKRPAITAPHPAKPNRKPKPKPKPVERDIEIPEESEAVESQPGPDTSKPQPAPIDPY